MQTEPTARGEVDYRGIALAQIQRAKQAGESHEMMARWISEAIHADLTERTHRPAPADDEGVVERVARAVLQDKVFAEARERVINDATLQGIEHHLIVVAAEHGARAALRTPTQAAQRALDAERVRAVLCEHFDPPGLHEVDWTEIARAIAEDRT